MKEGEKYKRVREGRKSTELREREEAHQRTLERGEEMHLLQINRVPPAGSAAERLGKQEERCV